jgi:hypothetical protein
MKGGLTVSRQYRDATGKVSDPTLRFLTTLTHELVNEFSVCSMAIIRKGVKW